MTVWTFLAPFSFGLRSIKDYVEESFYRLCEWFTKRFEKMLKLNCSFGGTKFKKRVISKKMSSICLNLKHQNKIDIFKSPLPQHELSKVKGKNHRWKRYESQSNKLSFNRLKKKKFSSHNYSHWLPVVINMRELWRKIYDKRPIITVYLFTEWGGKARKADAFFMKYKYSLWNYTIDTHLKREWK